MTWFEAYMLWNLDNLLGLCLFTGLISAGVTIFLIITRVAAEIDPPWKCVIPCGILAVLCFVVFLLTPRTETLLKIIATKKGVDAIQSDTGTQYLNETDKAIRNGLKLLNETIEKKLDKKEAD